MPDLFGPSTSPYATNTIAKPVPMGTKPYQVPPQAVKPPLMPDGMPVPQQPQMQPQQAPMQPQRPTTYSNYRDLYAGLANGLATQQTPGYDLLRGYSATKAGYLPDWAVHGAPSQQQSPQQAQAQAQANPYYDGQNGGVSGSESGDSDCVIVGSHLASGLRAEQLPVGALEECHHPIEGFHKHTLEAKGSPVVRPCVLLTTDGGAQLACSTTTPFNFVGVSSDLEEGGYALAPDMQGHDVYVLRDGEKLTERVVSVEHIGEQPVILLDFGGRSFPAGMTPDALIYSHNMRKAFSGAARIHGAEAARARFNGSRESGFMEGLNSFRSNPNAPAPMGVGSGMVDPTSAPALGDSGGWTTTYDAQGNAHLTPPHNTPIPSGNLGPAPRGQSFFGQVGNYARDHASQGLRTAGGLLFGPLGAIGGQIIGGMIGRKK